WEAEPSVFRPLFCGTSFQFGFGRQTLSLLLRFGLKLSFLLKHIVRAGPVFPFQSPFSLTMLMRRNVSDPLHGMIDKDGGLIIPKEGNYFVYSQVSFSDSGVFQHSVTLSRKKYLKNVTLMQSRKYPKESGSNSFLSGTFHLYEHDRIFVTVSNTSKIIQNNNYFGAFML
uniref:THD domain-containing protein n=1 Tax=Astatotilapia calliptera TaxID=8154 RepID=A0A3P8QDZ1_ASTCA